MLEEIINKNLNRIEKDLLKIKDLQNIDFLDVFPKSEEHRKSASKIFETIADALGYLKIN